MCSDVAIRAAGLSKVYSLYDRPTDRLKQMLWRGRQKYCREFSALQDVSFELKKGEVLGLVGRNGAGKSTLLQLICGTLSPTSGSVKVNGRVAALLELGAGFNPDFSGRENVYLNASILGLSRNEIDARYEEIVNFSGIRDFIDQPVKTYSSGMYVRLAFSIATSVDPDILVIDEALSVGDGEFARKSFDRIMGLKARGATILFCSHSLFQIESICSHAIWLDRGQIAAQGNPVRVVTAYQEFLDATESALGTGQTPRTSPLGHARLTDILVCGIPAAGGTIGLRSGKDSLVVEASFASDPLLPTPSIAVTLHAADNRIIASAGAWNDCRVLERDEQGLGQVRLEFPTLPLLKGRYAVSVHLFCERGLHTYDVADRVALLDVHQEGIEQGVVHLPHSWRSQPGNLLPGSREALRVAPPVHQTPAVSVADADALDWLTHRAPMLGVGERLAQDALTSAETLHGFAALAGRFGLTKDELSCVWQKTRMPRWQLGWARKPAQEAWMSLFAAAFGYPMSPALWTWKYANTGVLGTAAYANGEMVAFYGGIPRAIHYFGRPTMAIQISDVMVHPSERGVLTRTGAFQLMAATFFEQRVGYGRPHLLAFGFPEDKHLRLAARLDLYAPVDRMTEIRWPAATTRFDWRACARQVVPADANCVNALWGAMSAALQGSIVGVRDWDLVQHRYLNHPANRYTVMLVRRWLGGAAVGVVVLRDRGDEGVELLDFIAPPERFPLLLGVARRFAGRLGRSRVFCWITASHAGLLAGDAGACHPLDLVIPTGTCSPSPSVDEVRDHWWLMAGDTDFR